MMRIFLFLPVSLSAAKGKDRPAKLEPPPAQPITMSAASSAFSSCFLASSPITVWCINTWLSTLPSEYFVSSRVAASSTASLMAMPSEPGELGSCSRTFLPDCVSGLVAAGRAHALVLVVDVRRRAERLLQAPRAIERGGPPQPQDVAHLVGDLDPALAADLLLDQLHREQRREIGGADRLLGARMEN